MVLQICRVLEHIIIMALTIRGENYVKKRKGKTRKGKQKSTDPKNFIHFSRIYRISRKKRKDQNSKSQKGNDKKRKDQKRLKTKRKEKERKGQIRKG